jgi:hypothetical protein
VDLDGMWRRALYLYYKSIQSWYEEPKKHLLPQDEILRIDFTILFIDNEIQKYQRNKERLHSLIDEYRKLNKLLVSSAEKMGYEIINYKVTFDF